MGELKPVKGEIEVFGKNISTYKSYKEIGYVPQISVIGKIAFPITVTEIVSLNLYESFGFIKFARRNHLERVREILAYIDILSYKDYPVNELSGGLQQKTMIARAMINNPKLLILDEPTVGVNKASRKHFLKMIQRLNDEKKISILLVTHELEEVNKFTHINSLYEIKEGFLKERKDFYA